jgi:hypothetical protein
LRQPEGAGSELAMLAFWITVASAILYGTVTLVFFL